MKLRQNKAMARSFEVERLVREALQLSQQRNGREVRVTIPWNAFVFSTREGRPYMPPSLQKGLDKLPDCDGVLLTVQYIPFGGMFTRAIMRLASPLSPPVIAHETLHFVQFVGQMLLQLGQGHSPEWMHEQVHVDGRLVVGSRRPDGKLRPYDTMDYGMPKKRSRTFHFRPASAGGGGESSREHGVRDIEFMTNAVQAATQVLSFSGITPEELAQRAYVGLLSWQRTMEDFSPPRRRDFHNAVWGFLVERQRREYEQMGQVYPSTLTPKLRAIVEGGVYVPPRPAERPSERPQRPVRVAPEPKPKRERAEPLRPVLAGLHVRKEGREYRIYKDDAFTGKYGFSEEKANAIMARMR